MADPSGREDHYTEGVLVTTCSNPWILVRWNGKGEAAESLVRAVWQKYREYWFRWTDVLIWYKNISLSVEPILCGHLEREIQTSQMTQPIVQSLWEIHVCLLDSYHQRWWKEGDRTQTSLRQRYKLFRYFKWTEYHSALRVTHILWNPWDQRETHCSFSHRKTYACT